MYVMYAYVCTKVGYVCGHIFFLSFKNQFNEDNKVLNVVPRSHLFKSMFFFK